MLMFVGHLTYNYDITYTWWICVLVMADIKFIWFDLIQIDVCRTM